MAMTLNVNAATAASRNHHVRQKKGATTSVICSPPLLAPPLRVVLRKRPPRRLDPVPQAAREVSLPEKLGDGIGGLLEETRSEALVNRHIAPHEEQIGRAHV